MEKKWLVALASVGLLICAVTILPISQTAMSQQYEKQPQSQRITSGIYDVGGSSGIYFNFDVPSDATDARLTGRYEGYGGNQRIELRIGADCSDYSRVDSCSKQYVREEKAVSDVWVNLDSGKRYVLQFWNGQWFDEKQVESNLNLEYNVLVPISSSGSGGGSGGGGGCLIATAAFGSELTPQVQFLRDFRDNRVLSTTSGSNFMNVFNAWYYSFSPAVADFERSQPWMQQTVKAAIYPLLGILQLAEKSYSVVPGEYGSLTSGLVASSLIGAVYFMPLALPIKQIRTRNLDIRVVVAIIASLVTAVIVSLAVDSSIALMISTSALVLTTLSIAAVYSARVVWKGIETLRVKKAPLEN